MEEELNKQIEWLKARIPIFHHITEDYVRFAMKDYAQKYHESKVKNLSLSDVIHSLPTDEEINQVACDEMQQDWNDIRFQKVYKDGFIDGATWYRNKVKGNNV